MKTQVKNGAVKAAAESETIGGFHFLPRKSIAPDPSQPRKTFNPVTLQELADSIAELGIQQNLVVRFVPQEFTLHEPDLTSDKDWFVLDRKGALVCRDTEKECREFIAENAEGDGLNPRYVIVAGERRWRAAELAGLEQVPCMVKEDLDPKNIVKVQFAENDGREDLSALDEAESFHDLVYVRKLFTAEELAKELGKSRSHVFGRLKLAQLPWVVKEQVAGGKLNSALGELVAKVPGEKNQIKAMKEILEGGEVEYPNRDNGDYDTKVQNPMSVRTATRHLRAKYMLNLEDAPFDVKDKTLVPEAGACKDCPKRSGNCVALFPELERSPNVCTDPECFETKRKAHVRKATDALAVRGIKTLEGKEAKAFFGYGDSFDPYLKKSVDLESKIPGDNKKRTYKEVLGKEVPAKTAVVSPKGEVIEFFQRELIEAALEQKGFKFKREDKNQSAVEQAKAERIQEARVKLGKDLSKKVMTFVEGASGEKETLAFLRWLAAGMVDMRFYSLNQIENPLLKRFTNRDDIEAQAAKLKLGEAKSVLAAVVIGESLVDYNGEWDGSFSSGCKLAGIDLVSLEKVTVKWAEQDAAIDGKAELPGAKFEKEIAENTGKPKMENKNPGLKKALGKVKSAKKGKKK